MPVAFIDIIHKQIADIPSQVLGNDTTQLKNVNNCLNRIIDTYFVTSGGQSSNLYLNVVVNFFSTSLIKHLWHLKTVVFLHRCLIHAVVLCLEIAKKS